MKGEWIALLVVVALPVGGCTFGHQRDSLQSEAVSQQLNHDRWVQQELEDKLDEEKAATEEVAFEYREQRKKNQVVYRDLLSARQEDGDLTNQVAVARASIETHRAELTAAKAEAESLAQEVESSRQRVAELQRELTTLQSETPPLEGQRVELASRESALRAQTERIAVAPSRPADGVSGPQAEDPSLMGAATAPQGRRP